MVISLFIKQVFMGTADFFWFIFGIICGLAAVQEQKGITVFVYVFVVCP